MAAAGSGAGAGAWTEDGEAEVPGDGGGVAAGPGDAGGVAGGAGRRAGSAAAASARGSCFGTGVSGHRPRRPRDRRLAGVHGRWRVGGPQGRHHHGPCPAVTGPLLPVLPHRAGP